MNSINYDELINDLYYNLRTIDDPELKINLSKKISTMPMYDVYTDNIVLVEIDDIYDKLTKFNYRPVIGKTYDMIMDSGKEKLINFISNFDMPTLEATFYKHIYDRAPETSNKTDCMRPSFIPFLRTTTPYYTKTELTFLALNMGFDGNTNEICKLVVDNDVSGDILLQHQLYIRDNNADQYIKYYSFLGSDMFNKYLRNGKIYNPFIERNIINFKKLLENTPAWDKSYYFYRWINEDEFLKNIKVGSVWSDNSFMSVTRQPFIDPTNHYFGYILMKIKVPMNKKGCGLAIEYYSNFPNEQEIILPPSKYRLISNKNIKYYHPDKEVKDKISAKYIFEFIEANDNFLQKKTREEQEIPQFDFSHNNYSYDTSDKIKKFKYTYGNMCNIPIGNENVNFYIGDIETGPYKNFFYLNMLDNELDDKLLLLWQDSETGAINLFIEVGNVISVNYYFKYSGMETKIIGNHTYDDIVEFIYNLKEYFGATSIVIHPDYKRYWDIIDRSAIDTSVINSHTKQLYASDSIYFNQLLYHSLSDVPLVGFMRHLEKNKNLKKNIANNTLKYIMGINIDKFIIEYLNESDMIYDSYIELIFKIAAKLMKHNKIKKVVELYIYLMMNYCYLVDFFISYIKYKYNVDMNNTMYHDRFDGGKQKFNTIDVDKFMKYKKQVVSKLYE